MIAYVVLCFVKIYKLKKKTLVLVALTRKEQFFLEKSNILIFELIMVFFKKNIGTNRPRHYCYIFYTSINA